MKVLLPLDIVHSVEGTIARLPHLLNLKDAEVLFLYVREQLPAYELAVGVQADFWDDWNNQLEEKANVVLKEAADKVAGCCAKVETRIVVGPPAYMIENVAREGRFDVTVLTPGKHGEIEKFLIGSTSSAVAKHGPATVLIVRGKDREKVQSVVIGVDGSEQCSAALHVAARQFNLASAKIHLVHSVSLPQGLIFVSLVEYVGIIENNMRMEGETFLAAADKTLSSRGLKNVECVLKEGDPAAEIIKLAESVAADLVILGAQGKTAIQHFFMGSVSNRVVLHGGCSTAVIKVPRK